MALPRVRFTVRRLLVAIAIVAGLLGAGIEARRVHRISWKHALRATIHSQYEAFGRERAKYNTLMEAYIRSNAEEPSRKSQRTRLVQMAIEHAKTAEMLALWADYHASMKAKYEAAKCWPWSEVEPDPPEPPMFDRD